MRTDCAKPDRTGKRQSPANEKTAGEDDPVGTRAARGPVFQRLGGTDTVPNAAALHADSGGDFRLFPSCTRERAEGLLVPTPQPTLLHPL